MTQLLNTLSPRSDDASFSAKYRLKLSIGSASYFGIDVTLNNCMDKVLPPLSSDRIKISFWRVNLFPAQPGRPINEIASRTARIRTRIVNFVSPFPLPKTAFAVRFFLLFQEIIS